MAVRSTTPPVSEEPSACAGRSQPTWAGPGRIRSVRTRGLGRASCEPRRRRPGYTLSHYLTPNRSLPIPFHLRMDRSGRYEPTPVNLAPCSLRWLVPPSVVHCIGEKEYSTSSCIYKYINIGAKLLEASPNPSHKEGIKSGQKGGFPPVQSKLIGVPE